MAEIVDFNKAFEEKQKEKDRSDYFGRYLNCLHYEQSTGKRCECEVCNIHDNLANEAMDFLQKRAVEVMDNGGPTIYYGDLLTVLITASLKMKAICAKENQDATE